LIKNEALQIGQECCFFGSSVNRFCS